MKITPLILLVISFGALPCDLRAAGDQHATSAHPAEAGHASATPVDRPRSLLTSIAHIPQKSSQTGPLHIQPRSTPRLEIHQPVFKKPVSTVNHDEPLAKLPVGSGNAPARAEVVHSRSTAAAKVGGLTPSTTKRSAAVLDGSTLKRKPW